MRVDVDVWQEAQAYERRTWLTFPGSDMADDRNLDHAVAFGHYRTLLNIHFTRAVELGCGPFTNIRYILPVAARVDHLVLVDPLASEYEDHKWCRYGRLLRPGDELIASAIEDLPEMEPFGLVVMINVIEHCRDSDAVFATVARLLAPGGWLVAHEHVWPESGSGGDGHPLRLTWRQYVHAITDIAAPVYHKDVCNDGIRDVYIIGRRAE